MTRRSRVLSVLLTLVFCALFTVSIVNVAMPSIQKALGASSADLQWVVSGYSLTFGVMLVAAGRMGDLFGRAEFFMLGAAVFGLSSLVATFAPNMLVLNIARAFMGVGAGIFNPQVSSMIQQNYRGFERARAFAALGAVVGLGVAVGPVLGGVLLAWLPESWAWRTTLGINIPFALVAIILGYLWLPRNNAYISKSGEIVPEGTPWGAQARVDQGTQTGSEHAGSVQTASQPRSVQPVKKVKDFDPIGALILGLTILTLMTPFIHNNGNNAIFSLIGVATLLLIVWLMWEHFYEKRGHVPMVDLRLFKVPSFSIGAALITVWFAGTTSVWIILAMFIQQGLGYSPLVSGTIGLPGAILTSVSSIIAGRVMVKWGRKTILFGIIGTIISMLLAIWATVAATQGHSILWITAAFTVQGFTGGFVNSPNQAFTLQDVPVSQGGTASGIMQTGQRVATAVGVAMVTGLFFQQVPFGYAKAVTAAYLLIIAFMSIALVLGLMDLTLEKKYKFGDVQVA